MVEARRRPPGARDEQSRHRLPSVSSGSATPMDEDDDTPRRSTRGRNPLPPSNGPLFPPLPPKQPKSSPKNSPKISRSSPVARTPLAVSAVSTPLAIDTRQSPDETKLPSGSVTSLTPPPLTSEDLGDGVVDEEPARLPVDDDRGPLDEEPGRMGDEPDDWEAYRRHRPVRGFGAEVKLEPGEEEQTPKMDRRSPPGSPSASERAASLTRQSRKRRGEEQLLLDDHLLPAELRRTASGKRKGAKDGDDDTEEGAEEGEAEEAEEEEADAEEGEDEAQEIEDEEEDGKDVTRCVCQRDDGDPLMIQCDKCNVWQHGPCVGIWADEEAPDEYYCERCRPDLHVPLKKWIRSKGRNISLFVPPTPEDLKRLQPPTDRGPPSQSKLWTELKNKGARSHHRKEPHSPADPTLDRRSSRSKPTGRERTTSVKQEVKRRPSDHRRKTSVIPSASPEGSPHRGQPRARATIRSREMQQEEEELMAAMEASRREMMTSQEPDVEEEEEDKKGKRKREEDEPESHKKHPNQYTYRPKPPSFAAPPAAASPRKTAGTPVPTAPAHEHGTRRAEKIANGIKEQPFTAVSVSNLSFHLPDHLLAHSDLLSTSPVPLEVRSPRTMAFLPRNHFINQRYGPFTEDRDDDDNLLLPDEPAVREPTGEPGTHQEPPTRIRYPAKRITTGEVRKRVRHVLEYVGRVQQDEAKRHERAKLIGIDIKPLPRHDDELEPLDDVLKGPTSAQLLDELTRDLIAFQESFVQGMFASPLPPSISAFNTPTLPNLGFVSARDDTESGAEPQDGQQVVNGEEAQDRDVEMEHVEKGDEVDVYREGMVGVVVTEPEEEQAVERIEEAALSGV